MSEASTLTSSVAGRYAAALFDLAEESGALEEAERDLDTLKAALADSEDLRRLIRSPLYGREEQAGAIDAVLARMEVGRLVRNLAGVMASKRRLFALPGVIDVFGRLLAEHRGEVTAHVTAARRLSDAQVEALRTTLRDSLDRKVKLDIQIDPALIGGMIVKVGSRMIDTSIRSKLANLQNAMKEAG